MEKDAKACSVCETAFESAPLQCPLCNAEVGDEDTVCPNCGADLQPPAGNIDREVVETAHVTSEKDRDAAEDIADSVFVDVELEELVKLPDVGPLRAKILFDAGYTELRKLKQASVVELMNIRGIGRKAAGEIKTALRELSLEEIREKPLTRETVGEENQCPLCGTVVSAFETSCYECGCDFGTQDLDNEDSDRLALSYYDSKLLRAPDNKDLWYARGATLVKMETYEQALNSFNRAIEIDPSFQTAWMSKAEVYNRLGDSAKAAECYSHIMTAASGGQMPGTGENEPDATLEKVEEDLQLEPPPEPPASMKVAEPDLTQPPVDYDDGSEPARPSGVNLSELQMDFKKTRPKEPDLDAMSEVELKKELAKLAADVKPYLKLAKEMGVDINHAKKLVARAVSESKQNEFKVAIMLINEGIEFARSEFHKRILGDIEGLTTVLKDLKLRGNDVSIPVSLVTETKELLEAGDIAESVEKLKRCLEEVERIASS